LGKLKEISRKEKKRQRRVVYHFEKSLIYLQAGHQWAKKYPTQRSRGRRERYYACCCLQDCDSNTDYHWAIVFQIDIPPNEAMLVCIYFAAYLFFAALREKIKS